MKERPAEIRNMFPLVSFDLVDNTTADELLSKWGHWLGGCHRPFGRQSFALKLHQRIVSVAVSASTINGRCGGYSRSQAVELARLCSDPSQSWASRCWVSVVSAAVAVFTED